MKETEYLKTKNDLVGIVGAAFNDWEDYNDDCRVNGRSPDESVEDYVADAVIRAGCRKQIEWISVEERVPECERGAESKAVLFITKQGFMYTGYYGCGGIFHDRYFREFKNATEGYDISNVTHWMPLPEPPKMKGE